MTRPEARRSNEILREEQGGVSPVVATILLVAITVVLAAVLYVMVSGLFNPHNTNAEFLGVSVGSSGNGTLWVLTVVSVSGTVTQNETTLTLLNASGGSALAPTNLFRLEIPTKGVQYVPFQWGPATVSVGDRLIISKTGYPTGTQFQLVSPSGVLDTGELR